MTIASSAFQTGQPIPAKYTSIVLRWPSLLEFAAALHSRVQALDALKVDAFNFNTFGRELSDELAGNLCSSAAAFVSRVEKLQAELRVSE